MDVNELLQVVSVQGQLLGEQSRQIHTLEEKLVAILDKLYKMMLVQLSSLAIPEQNSAALPAPKIPFPECYDGNPSDCRGFLNQCRLHFRNQPQEFSSAQARVTFFISLL